MASLRTAAHCMKERFGRHYSKLTRLKPVMVMCVYAIILLSCIGAHPGGQQDCRFDTERSVLRVTVTKPDPKAWGYYVFAEREDDPNIMFDQSKRVKNSDADSGAMVYEVANIPTTHRHRYKVLVRPHRRNWGIWLAGYRQLCALTIPPLPTSPPHSAPSPLSHPEPLNIRLDFESNRAQSPKTGYRGPKPRTVIIITCAVVTFFLVLCVTVTIAGFVCQRRRKRHRERTAATAASAVGATFTDKGYVKRDTHDDDDDCSFTIFSTSDISYSDVLEYDGHVRTALAQEMHQI